MVYRTLPLAAPARLNCFSFVCVTFLAQRVPYVWPAALTEMYAGACDDRRKMPRSDDKLGEVVFEKLEHSVG